MKYINWLRIALVYLFSKDLILKVVILLLFMWNINNMAHFNNIRSTVLDNNNKITKIGIKIGSIKVEDEEEDDYEKYR